MNTLTLVKDQTNTYRYPSLAQRESQAIRENAIAVLEARFAAKSKAMWHRCYKVDMELKECRFRLAVVKARLYGTEQYEGAAKTLKEKIILLWEEGQALIQESRSMSSELEKAVRLINEEESV